MSPQARQLINPSDIHPAPGFSHVAIKGGNTLVSLAGQVALAPDLLIEIEATAVVDR